MDQTFAGRHLMIDAYVKDATLLRDNYTLERMLKDVARILDMRIISGPHYVSVDEKSVQDPSEFEDIGGLSGFCIISTSHLSFHAWPELGYISLDVYSCKDFDAQKAIDFLNNFLQIARSNISDVVRRKPHAS